MTDGVSLGVSGSGYATVHVDGERFYVHRLAAVAEHGLEAVVGSDVHHVDGNAWNNNPENLEPVEPGEHRGANLPGGSTPGAWVVDRSTT